MIGESGEYEQVGGGIGESGEYEQVGVERWWDRGRWGVGGDYEVGEGMRLCVYSRTET